MTAASPSTLQGWELFARYAFPPNELGYCGPADASVLLRGGGHDEVSGHARGFDGAWPYLLEIAAAAGVSDPLDTEVVRSYWIGGGLLGAVDGAALTTRLRTSLATQPTGVLDTVDGTRALAHHSFQVFAVYPWIRFLDADAGTPLRIMQACRIRWGRVDAVHDEHVDITSRPLRFDGGLLGLGDAVPEVVRWRRGVTSLAPAPAPGDVVAAHWDWICGTLDDDEVAALTAATASSLDLVNATRR